jgi:hypothetical protein
MSSEVLLHIKQTLSMEQRQPLQEHLEDHLYVAGDVHASGKPHLAFVPVDLAKASPHRILAALRERGYDVRQADL